MRALVLIPIAATLLLLGVSRSAASDPEALLKKHRDTVGTVKAVRGTWGSSLAVRGEKAMSFTGDFLLQRPSMGKMVINNPDGRKQIMLSDGKSIVIEMPEMKQYVKISADDDSPQLGQILGPPVTSPLALLLAEKNLLEGYTFEDAGSKTIDKREFQVVKATREREPKKLTLFFGTSGLIEGIESDLSMAGEPAHLRTWMRNLQLNPAFKPKQFAYTPPKGFQAIVQPDFNKSLLAVGKTAPDFKLPMPGGGEYSLAEALKDKKAVLVNFWFYG